MELLFENDIEYDGEVHFLDKISFHSPIVVSDPCYGVDTSDNLKDITGDPNKKAIQYFAKQSSTFIPFYMADKKEAGKRIYSLGIISAEWYHNDKYYDFEELTRGISYTINHYRFYGDKVKCINLRSKTEDFEGIGVDSAKCGFIEYDLLDHIDIINGEAEIIIDDGFVISTSGIGDGLYNLYGIIINDHIVGYFIDYDVDEYAESVFNFNHDTFKIFFDDLKEEKQQEYLDLFGDNGNHDVIPIAVLIKNNSEEDK